LDSAANKDRVIWVFETQKALTDLCQLRDGTSGPKRRLRPMVQDTGGMFSGAVSVAPGVYVYRLTETGSAAEPDCLRHEVFSKVGFD